MGLNRQELTVCVVSGPTFSGKSYLLNWLLGLREYIDALLIEMGLPTGDNHYKPLVATIAGAQRYIEEIECERGNEFDLKINLRVVLHYCDIESVKRRIGYRQD